VFTFFCGFCEKVVDFYYRFGYISSMKNKNSINERQDEASSQNI